MGTMSDLNPKCGISGFDFPVTPGPLNATNDQRMVDDGVPSSFED